jgi:hypothetical protein
VDSSPPCERGAWCRCAQCACECVHPDRRDHQVLRCACCLPSAGRTRVRVKGGWICVLATKGSKRGCKHRAMRKTQGDAQCAADVDAAERRESNRKGGKRAFVSVLEELWEGAHACKPVCKADAERVSRTACPGCGECFRAAFRLWNGFE